MSERNQVKRKKTFYDILWSMCESQKVIDSWIYEGYLGKSRDTYYWTAKAQEELACIAVGEITVNEGSIETSSETIEEKSNQVIENKKASKAKKQEENFKEKVSDNKLEEFIKLFSKTNIGIPGKTTPKITVVKKLIKFFNDYPDYTMEDIISATTLYIETMKKEGSIKFIRECGYFIYKKIDGIEQSDLAKWCEESREGGQNYTSHNII